jgi:hypothetical protein
MALRDYSRWLRLFRTSLPHLPILAVYFPMAWSEATRKGFLSAFPPSVRAELVAMDLDEAWKSLLEPTQLVALIVSDGVLGCWNGAPSDEAWDEVEELSARCNQGFPSS